MRWRLLQDAIDVPSEMLRSPGAGHNLRLILDKLKSGTTVPSAYAASLHSLLKSDWSPSIRGKESLAWLESSGRIDALWLAVDDMAAVFSANCLNLFVVDGTIGLNARL
jgi:hypothetical protein